MHTLVKRKRLTEELDEAALAVRLVVLLLEGAFVELLQAEGADEVLRVKLLGHGGDAAPRDGLLAAGAERAAPLVVVNLAVRLAVVLKEASVHERCEALLQTHSKQCWGLTSCFIQNQTEGRRRRKCGYKLCRRNTPDAKGS